MITGQWSARCGALQEEGKTMFARRLVLAAGIATAAALPAAAEAQTNYSTLTSAVDFSGAITAILAVAALVAAVLVIRKGIRFVLGALR